MAHSIFNGVLRVGSELDLPVKLYSAVEPRRVGFRLLHASDGVPVQQRMVHPNTGEEVTPDAVRKGLVRPTGTVVIRDDELEALEPDRSRELEVLRFVPPGRIDHRWYLRPYYLGPASSGGEASAPYFEFARALAAEDMVGVVRWTMRNKLYRGGLRAIGDHLVLISLRSASELVAVTSLPEQSWPTPSQAELGMARQLIAMLEAPLDWDQFHDDYAEQVAALAAAKAAGRAPSRSPRTTPPAEPESLTSALAASIQHVAQARRDAARQHVA